MCLVHCSAAQGGAAASICKEEACAKAACCSGCTKAPSCSGWPACIKTAGRSDCTALCISTRRSERTSFRTQALLAATTRSACFSSTTRLNSAAQSWAELLPYLLSCLDACKCFLAAAAVIILPCGRTIWSGANPCACAGRAATPADTSPPADAARLQQPESCSGEEPCSCSGGMHRCRWALAGSTCPASLKPVKCTARDCTNRTYHLCAAQQYSDGEGNTLCWSCASDPKHDNFFNLRAVFKPAARQAQPPAEAPRVPAGMHSSWYAFQA